MDHTQPAAVWIDGDPQMEAVAAAVWEQCRTEDTSLVVDDPRNIAAVAVAAIRTAAGVQPDRADVEHARGIARRLAAHAEGFQDVLDETDRGPWVRTVGADITALRAALGELAAPALPEHALSPYYEHPDCGFRWHGRDGMDIPVRDGQPVCPRCELDRLRAELEQARTENADVDTVASRAAEAISNMGADLRAVAKERDRYRSAWTSARERAVAYGEGILRVVKDRESYQGWLKEAEARTTTGQDTTTPPVEGEQEIRQQIARELDRLCEIGAVYSLDDAERRRITAAVLPVVRAAVAAEVRRTLEDVIPAWEAVYESATFTPHLIGYCNDEAPAKDAALAWFRSNCETDDLLGWEPDPGMANGEWDQWFALGRIDADGTALATDIIVRHRSAPSA